MTNVTDVVAELKTKGYKRIYVSHEPNEERQARLFAEKLKKEGFTVIVGADARPHKDNPHDEKDLEVVRQVIDSCDVVILSCKREEN